jgi:hypothetical protein
VPPFLGNLWQPLALPTPIGKWSLTRLQQWLAKTGGRLINRARYYRLLLVESHLTRRLVWRHTAEDRNVAVASGPTDGKEKQLDGWVDLDKLEQPG